MLAHEGFALNIWMGLPQLTYLSVKLNCTMVFLTLTWLNYVNKHPFIKEGSLFVLFVTLISPPSCSWQPWKALN
jgi:hypothetical protein